MQLLAVRKQTRPQHFTNLKEYPIMPHSNAVAFSYVRVTKMSIDLVHFALR